MKLSVIICTHNPRRDYLSRALHALRRQTLPVSEWELLVVDNASQLRVADLVSLDWHPNARHIREEALGLTQARLRGMQEAQGQLLVFVDDDNLLDPFYLEIATAIDETRPDLGCWGAGRIEPEYEKPPPEWLSAYDHALAIRRLDRDLWANIPALNHSLPFGAGMCVRRVIADRYVSHCRGDHVRRSLGRSGASLLSGEDTDIAMLACAFGMGTASLTKLRITHLIPERRTTRQYMSRLVAGLAESHVVLSSLHKLEKHNVSHRRLQILKWKCLFFWTGYVVSGFSVHYQLALSKARGELHGCKRLRNLGVLGQNGSGR